MGFSYAQGLILLVTASMLTVCMANKTIAGHTNYFGFNYTNWAHKNVSTQGPNKIIVGGSEHWHFGFNYADWSFKNGPFYLNDTLVFKYDPPNSTNVFLHSVYLLPNLWSFLACDLSRAKLLANPTQGGGEGFEFVLKKWQPYYFACGEHDGAHCKDGKMKFSVMPLPRRWHH